MTTTDKLAGVIGGMGPDATIDFMARVLEYTPADGDQDHVRMLVDHNPRVPSRQLARRERADRGVHGIPAGAGQYDVHGAFRIHDRRTGAEDRGACTRTGTLA